MYSTIDMDLITANVIQYGLSDHDLIYIVIKKPFFKIPKESFRCRDLSNYSRENIELALQDIDWNSFYNMSDANAGWQILYNHYIEALGMVAPFIFINNVKKRKHWTTPFLLHLIRERDSFKSTADALSCNKAYESYKTHKNKVKHETMKAKRAFIMSKISDANENPRKYWKELNSVFNPSDNDSCDTVI